MNSQLQSGLKLLNAISPQPSTSNPRPKKKTQEVISLFSPDDPLVIGFGHKRGSGKDTSAGYFCKHYQAERIAFADPIKALTMVAYGLDRDQAYGDQKERTDPFWDVSPAELQQVEGTELHRKRLAEIFPQKFGNQNIWVRMARRRIEEGESSFYVISDLRFPNEADMVKELDGFCIRVDCDFETRMRRTGGNFEGRDDDHYSEVALDDFTGWDFIVDNNGSEDDLKRGLETVIRQVPVEKGIRKNGNNWQNPPEEHVSVSVGI